MWLLWFSVVLCFAHQTLSVNTFGKPLRGKYLHGSSNDDQNCPKPVDGLLNVHLVCHTHDDVGWLKTVDQYYYGSHSNIQKAGVQYILDSVVQELLHDKNKKFIYVETAFFWKWWKEQTDFVKHQVKNLVKSGQLEFIGGGWSMNDEAVTHYHSIVDQFTWGFRKLNESFGEAATPKVGWQIDPFGHSREMASIFAQLGFDGLFLGRLDYQDKETRLLSKTAEMVWQGSSNLDNTKLFTNVLYNNYSPPPGFCFDVLCDDEPMIDSKRSPDYNVDEKVKLFTKYAEMQAKSYSTNNIILTMGDDFNYQDAHMWFKNLDKLIRYVNAQQSNGSKVNVFYSTPSCYLKAVHKADLTWPVKEDDFFPYASDPHTYWTGYFTSRPTIKGFERLGNNFLQVCKQLYTLADLGPEDQADLNKMREAMGVMQHHDAITGTEKQPVANDYARILTEGFAECQIAVEAAVNKIVSNKKPSDPVMSFNSCLLLNVSQCNVSEKANSFVVTLYNPLSRPVTHYVRLPVTEVAYSVKDPAGKDVPVQIVPVPKQVLLLPERKSAALYELVFVAVDLPPLGLRSYYVSKHRSKRRLDIMSKIVTENFIGHKDLKLLFDLESGKPTTLERLGLQQKFSQDFLYYKGYDGDNREFKNRSSGAYIFRPHGTDAFQINSKPTTTMLKGPIVEEVHQVFSDWVSQVIRIYNGANHVEFEWQVGPIPVEDGVGKEVISRFSSGMNNKGIFYTDSNGRELIIRKRNFRPTWKVNISEPVSANYFPVTTRILQRDMSQKVELAVVPDRAQGGSSLKDGELELMVHRRLLHDDAFGVGEPLNETAFGKGLVARGKHFVLGGPLSGSGKISLAAEERELIQQKVLAPWTLITPADTISFKEWQNTYNMEYSGLTRSLPPNVQILTLEPWIGTSILLRLEHILEKDEDPNLSKPVVVSLTELFKPFKIESVHETTLGANQWMSKSKRLQWKVESNEIDRDVHQIWRRNYAEEIFSVNLSPMMIRTFILQVTQNHQYV